MEAREVRDVVRHLGYVAHAREHRDDALEVGREAQRP